MRRKSSVVDVHAPSGDLVARAPVARSMWSRTRGLIGRPLAEGEGLLLPSCSSVHTHFMSYPIDVVYLSSDETIVKIVSRLRPWRFSGTLRGAKHVLELPAGRAAASGLEPGQQLTIEPAAMDAAP